MGNRKTTPWQFGGLSLGQLLQRTWNELNADDAFDSAAALGYYFLLSLLPMLIFLVSIMAIFRSTPLMNVLLDSFSRVMPGAASNLLKVELTGVISESKGGLITFGIVATLWAASSGVASLMDGLNRAYEVKETRPFAKRRLMAIGLTLALSMLTIVGAGMLVASDGLAALLHAWTSLEWMNTVGVIIGIVVGLASMLIGFELMFYFGPNVENPQWYWATPGSVSAVLLLIAGSFGFSQYIRFSNSYDSVTYGPLGAVMVLMLWLYIMGLAIMIGGELNSEIAKAALERGNSEAPHAGEEREKGPAKGEPSSNADHSPDGDPGIRATNGKAMNALQRGNRAGTTLPT